MTNEDILRMAREAGFVVDEKAQQHQPNCIFHTHHMVDELLQRFANLVRADEREAIMDEWSACVQSDLENGVRWLNEQAAKKWRESYPAMAGFADKIYMRGETE